MNTKKIITLVAFVLMVVAQIYIPWRMVITHEDVLEEGTAFRFRTAPVDPHDPFRGKYITLSFPDNGWSIQDASGWDEGEEVFVSMATDSAGFATIAYVSGAEPGDQEAYFRTTISYVLRDSISRIFVTYPFDRFYMNEGKAQEAETLYREAAADSTSQMYALVRVGKGKAVLQDVILRGISIADQTGTPPPAE